MIDDFLKNQIQNTIDPWKNRIVQSGMSDKKLIYISFAFGILACLCVAFQSYIPALIFIVLNRLLDSLAFNLNNNLKFAPVFDIAFFGGFIFFFSLGVLNTSMAALCLMLAYLLRLAGTQDPNTNKNIIENSEIIIFMVLCCLFPQSFAAITIMFAIVCMIDAIKRFYDGIRA